MESRKFGSRKLTDSVVWLDRNAGADLDLACAAITFNFLQGLRQTHCDRILVHWAELNVVKHEVVAGRVVVEVTYDEVSVALVRKFEMQVYFLPTSSGVAIVLVCEG